ncbi:HigA family addiction module antitoxin [Candidatus Neomarinimicrobiota bacterium]
MVNYPNTAFEPDYAIPPGIILEEILSSRGIKKVELAERCGLSEKHISQITKGKASISPETAIQLETVLGISAVTWTNLEANHKLHLAKQEAQAEIRRQADWVNKFPLKDLTKRGILPRTTDPVETAEKLLSFFRVASIDAWEMRFKQLVEVYYRDSTVFKSNPVSISAWLRFGEKIAEEIDTAPYDRELFLEGLTRIRNLTKESPNKFEPLMKEYCRKAGIVVTFVPGLSASRLCGATRWLQPDKALIMLSLRYHWEDIFWFTFFHEAAHILMHNKKERFLDEEGMKQDQHEKEADAFAASFLIPDAEYRAFTDSSVFSRGDILSFAKKLDIAPGIVVGRLQHDKLINYSWHNNLRRRFSIQTSNVE